MTISDLIECNCIKPCTLQVRWMIARDMDRVMEIEMASFTSPWSAHDFLQLLRRNDVIGLVCEVDRETTGYCIYHLGRRGFYICNLAVAESWRHRGIATSLVKAVCCKAHNKYVHAWPNETDFPAEQLFKSLGFMATGIEHIGYEAVHFVWHKKLAANIQSERNLP